MIQLAEAFDVLVERGKAMEETLLEPPRSVTTKTEKKSFDRSKPSWRPGKKGREFRRSGRNDWRDSRSSLAKL